MSNGDKMRPTSGAEERTPATESASRAPVLNDSDLGQGLGEATHPETVMTNSREGEEDVSVAQTPQRPGSDTLAGGTDEDIFRTVHEQSIDDAKESIAEGGTRDSSIEGNRDLDEAATAQRKGTRNALDDENASAPGDDESTENVAPHEPPVVSG